MFDKLFNPEMIMNQVSELQKGFTWKNKEFDSFDELVTFLNQHQVAKQTVHVFQDKLHLLYAEKQGQKPP